MCDETKPKLGSGDLPDFEELRRIVSVPSGMLEAVEDVFVASGAELVDRWQLEWIVRAVLYVDHHATSSKSECVDCMKQQE